jgi:hypothetical protein
VVVIIDGGTGWTTHIDPEAPNDDHAR